MSFCILNYLGVKHLLGDLGVYRASLMAQMAEMWATWVQSPDQEDPLEKGMATHSSVLAWRIPWTEEPGGLQSIGLQRVGQD